MPLTVNITAPNNADFRRVFCALDRSGKVRGDLDLSQWLWTARREKASTLVALQAGTDPAIGGLQILAPLSAGQFVLFIPYRVMRNLAEGAYYHDLIEVTPLGYREVFWSGSMTIGQGITR